MTKLSKNETKELNKLAEKQKTTTFISRVECFETEDINPERSLVTRILYQAILKSKPNQFSVKCYHHRNISMVLDYCFNGLSYNEISRKFNIDGTNVKNAINKTILSLQKEILKHV